MGSGGSRPAVGKQRSLRSGKRIRTQRGGLAKKTTAATLQAKKKMTAATKTTAATRMRKTTSAILPAKKKMTAAITAANKTTSAILPAKKKMTAAMTAANKTTSAILPAKKKMTAAMTAATKTTSAATLPAAKNYSEAARPPTTKRMTSYKQKLVEGLSNKKVLSSITITQLTALYSTLYGPTVLQKLKS